MKPEVGTSARSPNKPRGRPPGTTPLKLADAPASHPDCQPSPDVIVRQEADGGALSAPRRLADSATLARAG